MTKPLVFNSLNAILIGLFSLFLFLLFLQRRSKVIRGREPPLVAGGWPIIGHLLLLSGSQVPHLTLGAMADKYGPIFTIMLGLHRAVVLNNWKVAKECFTINDLAVSTRPRLVAVQQMSYNQAMFAFAPYSPYWREMRKIATLELLSNRRIELLSHVRVSEVETSIKELYKLWNDKRNHSDQVQVEMMQWFGELTLNVILRIIAGKRNYDNACEADQEEAQRWLKAMREFFHLMGLFVVGDSIPWLRWLDLGGHEKAMKENIKELDTILGEWLDEHRKKRASGETTVDQDFINIMLSVLDGIKIIEYNTDTIIKSTLLILVAAAIDTTTATLTWAICFLLNNPCVLKEAQNELEIQVGKERIVKESDISNLVYIQAIVKETLRLHPAAPLSGPREFTEDCIIDGYQIQKGTRLITNLWKIHTDPSIWSDPLEFKPERFLTTHKDVDVRGHDFELIPFGSGRRICPGISFALHTIHLALARFLQSFEISKTSDEPIDMTEIFGLTNMKATPLEVLIKPRLTSNLYG
ncbi:PREDICTED: cytochrome P450 82A3-like isoform X1 [Lupinus angustifolius]|nr:PREDICTED: cytochrome P450 82A3-like isoform X1 [Lupinus angustifolius]XP_019440639.1 PREDICTED: cytochrome P450 82A3-like isoform X1 [Lupinus angustifolius]